MTVNCMVLSLPLLITSVLALNGETSYVATEQIPLSPQMSYGHEKWRFGRMLSVDTGQPSSIKFTVAGPNDKILSTFSFSLSGVSRLWVNDFDMGSDGTIVFSGQCYSSDGRLAPFLGIRRPTATDVSLIQTYPYRPWTIALAPDGTIWTSGLESKPDTKPHTVNPTGNVLRHFDASGNLLASTQPYGDLKQQRGRAISGTLQATSTLIGWYSPLARTGVYVELSPDLKSKTVYPGLVDSQGQVLGFSLTPSGNAYITWDSPKGRATYELNRSLRQWIKLSIPQKDPAVTPVLKGLNNERLVFREGYALDVIQASAH